MAFFSPQYVVSVDNSFVAEKEARAMPLENSPTQSAAVYCADQSNCGYDTSQTYYQVFICDSLFCVI